MKKLVNALDRIVGLAFFAVFAIIPVLAWRYGGPFGIITQKVHVIFGALVFIFSMVFDFAMIYWYCHALSSNSYKFTDVLKHMLKSPAITFAAIYNWFTAD